MGKATIVHGLVSRLLVLAIAGCAVPAPPEPDVRADQQLESSRQALVASPSVLTGSQPGAIWPMHGASAQHDARTEIDAARTAAPTWKRQLLGSIRASAAIAEDGTAYVSTAAGKLYAFDASHNVRWEAALLASGTAPAIGADGTVYVATAFGELLAFDPSNGAIKWRHFTVSSIGSAPTIGRDGTIYFGNELGNLFAVTPQGARKWTHLTLGSIKGSPTLDADDNIYVGNALGTVVAVSPTGTRKWTQWLGLTEIESSAALHGDTLYLGGGDGFLYALDRATGAVRWKRFLTGPLRSSPAVGDDGTIYVGSALGRLFALEASGAVRWSYQTLGPILSTPAVDRAGAVYFGSSDFHVYALDGRANGSVLWRHPTLAPVLAPAAIGRDGAIYIGNELGQLHGIGRGKGAMLPLITSVTIDPPSPCVGEDVFITVGTSHPDGGSVRVQLGSREGAEQWIAATRYPGTNKVSIAASTAESYVDSRDVEFEVRECPGVPVAPELSIYANPFNAELTDLVLLDVGEEDGPFEWDFGDGSVATTRYPFASHAYQPSIQRDVETATFDVEVTGGDSDWTVHRTVSVVNSYALMKKRGIVSPRVSTPSPRLTRNGQTYSSALQVTNRESQPLTFDTLEVEVHSCNSNAGSVLLPSRPVSFTVPAGQTTSYTAEVPVSAVGEGCSVAIRLLGATAALRATAVAYLDVPDATPEMEIITDAANVALLNEAIAVGALDPRSFSEEDLYRLQSEGRFQKGRGGLRAGGTRADDEAPPLSDFLGRRCSPGDTPPREGLSCQLSGEMGVVGPRLVNALKGDSVLSAVCNNVGSMLAQVSPPQLYGHVGIMSRDHVEILNSTTITDRFQYYGADPAWLNEISDGIDEDVLRYGIPGIIKQPIEEAFGTNGGTRVDDPSSGLSWHISHFSRDSQRCTGGESATIVEPIVLKPQPGSGVAGRRALLRQAADAADALRLSPDMHYRFYAYTEGAISNDPEWIADETWASGSLPSMCSSYIWAAFTRAGIPLEGELEQLDEDNGAETEPGRPDGMYFYSAGERRAATRSLYSSIYAEVKTGADLQNGWFGKPIVWLQDAADDVANQTVNCFTSDWCDEDAKDSRAWKDTGSGYTVSPDDMMFWDVYGNMERVVYRSARFSALSEWAAAEGTGSVTGVVRGHPDQTPVEGASIVLMGIEQTSDENGEFRFDAIPAGEYEVEASGWVDGEFVNGKAVATVVADTEASVTITIGAPDPRFRRVTVFTPQDYQGGVFIYNDNIGNSSSDWYHFSETFLMDVDDSNDSSGDAEADTVADFEWEQCQGDEVTTLIQVHLELNPDLTVSVSGSATLYETTNCSHSGRVGSHNFSGLAEPKENGNATNWADRFEIENENFFGSVTDYTKVWFMISNDIAE